MAATYIEKLMHDMLCVIDVYLMEMILKGGGGGVWFCFECE